MRSTHTGDAGSTIWIDEKRGKYKLCLRVEDWKLFERNIASNTLK
jgi:hypothetical protein